MDITYKVTTKKSFDKAIIDLKACLSKRKFGVLWELNFQDKLKEKGLDFDRKFQVLEVCNPVKAKEILDIQIEVGYFLPCKVVVYEEDNYVIIGMVKPTQLITFLNQEDLLRVATDVESDLIDAINETKSKTNDKEKI